MNKKLQLKIHKLGESEEKILQKNEATCCSIVEDQTEFINRFKPDGTVIFVNEACCRYFQKRYDEFVGTNFMPLLPSEDQEKLKQLLLSLTPENPVATLEHRVITPKGEICWQHWTNRALFDEKGNLIEFQAVGFDITKRKEMEQALVISEERFRVALRNSPIVVFNQDRDLRHTWIYNPRHGYSPEYILGKTDTELFDIEHASRLSEIKRGVIESGVSTRIEVSINFQENVFFYDMTVEPTRDLDSNITGITCVAIDITERKQAEQIIKLYKDQLSRLTSRLSFVEEKGKRKIAMDLHDNIGQILACANMMLKDLRISAPGDFRNSLEEIHLLIQQSIEYTRSLTFELGTPLLYEIGLESAVERLGQEFQKKHGVTFTFQDDKKAKPLQDDVRTVLFHSIRELLTNVVKHAGAHAVTVSLKRKNHSIQATVADDGVGFDVASIYDESYLKCGFGLFSIRERLKNIGGYFDIRSEPGSATRITLTAPLGSVSQ